MGCLPGSAQRSSPHEQSPDRVRCTPGTTGQRHSSTTRRSVRAMRAAMAEDPSTDPPLGPTGLHTDPEGRASRDPPSCPASLGSSTSCAVSAFRGSTTSYPPSLYRRHLSPIRPLLVSGMRVNIGSVYGVERRSSAYTRTRPVTVGFSTPPVTTVTCACRACAGRKPPSLRHSPARDPSGQVAPTNPNGTAAASHGANGVCWG
jgi:hypothetical protein